MKIPSQFVPSLALQNIGCAFPILQFAMVDPCWDSWHGGSFPTWEYISVGEEEWLFAYVRITFSWARFASLRTFPSQYSFIDASKKLLESRTEFKGGVRSPYTGPSKIRGKSKKCSEGEDTTETYLRTQWQTKQERALPGVYLP